MKMLKRIAEKIKNNLDCQGDFYRVDVLDGIRAMSVLFVLWFHFWQQTWLMPYYNTPYLSWLGVTTIDFNPFRYCGYLFVDMMVLVSAFSLFLPHARTMVLGEPVPKIKDFYVKRVARIVPSYLVCIIVLLIIALANNLYYGNTGWMIRDVLTHLTFTQMFFYDSYIATNLGVVLWTVSLLVLFYAVFPFLAYAFRRIHIFLYAAMVVVGVATALYFTNTHEEVSMYVNQFPTFLPVFANGMLAALAYVWYTKKCRIKRLLSPLFTVLAIGAAVAIVLLVKSCYSNPMAADAQRWQLENRYVLSLAFMGFLLFSALAIKPYRMIFSNRAAKSLAAISFNIYIWHQWLIVQLRSAMGYQHGGDVSSAGGNAQVMLTVQAFLLSVLVAVIMTYCVEKPCAKLIMKWFKKGEKKDALSI